VIIADRDGKTEEEVLREEVKKEKLHLRLTPEQNQERLSGEAAVKEIEDQINLEEDEKRKEILKVELEARKDKLDVLMEKFAKEVLEVNEKTKSHQRERYNPTRQGGHSGEGVPNTMGMAYAQASGYVQRDQSGHQQQYNHFNTNRGHSGRGYSGYGQNGPMGNSHGYNHHGRGGAGGHAGHAAVGRFAYGNPNPAVGNQRGHGHTHQVYQQQQPPQQHYNDDYHVSPHIQQPPQHSSQHAFYQGPPAGVGMGGEIEFDGPEFGSWPRY